ncbi:MAG TPA: GAF domain-containing protein, partial [Candidatus Binatia bacterium]|nr:GAF domain-containing protein [Candidatus Binatia bacterium]
MKSAMAKQLRTPHKHIGAHRYHPSLRSLLIVLVTSTVVPIFLFSVWLIVLQSQREMEAIEERLVDTAQAIAIDVDREVVSIIQSLQTLALDFDLDTARTREFQELSNRILSSRQAWKTVIVSDPSGKSLVSVSRQTDQAQPANSPSDESLDIFKAQKGGSKHSPLAFLLGSSVTVHVPISFEQKIKYFASVLLDPKVFAGLLSQHKVSPEWLVSIIDSKKITVASSRFGDKLFGKPTQLLLPSSGHSAPGQLFRSKIEDVPSYVILSTAPVSQWSVALAVPAAVVEAPYYRMLWLIVGVGLLCLIAGITIAYVIGRKVAKPLERLAADAKDRAQGKYVESSPNGSLTEVETINEALDQSADLLKEREQERDYFSEELDVRLHDLAGLHKLTTSLLAVDDRQVLFNEIVAGALILLKADKGSLHLTDQKTQSDVVAQIGFPNQLDECLHSPARTAMTTRRPVVIDDIAQDSNFNDQQRAAASEAGVRAAVSFPLTAPRRDIMGVLSSYFSQPFKPSQWQVILMDLYAQYCVNIIEQMRAKEELRAHNNGLEDRVKDNSKKLEEAYLQRINELTRQRELEKGLREAQK